MSTSIPQFNIRDVNNALILLLNNPDATFEQLYCPIDFATGGIIINEDEVKESLRSGHGKSARIRAKIEYDVKKHQLIVTEMPYSVYTNTVCAQLQELLEKEPNTGIEKFIDATGEKPCIKITLTKKANPESVKQWLYSNTSLQNYYSINMIMLEGGRTPRLFGWVDALKSHLEHVKEVKRAELQADLDKAVARLEIVNGYLIALANIEEVIDIIKRAENAAQAALNLMAKFGFTERQAKAILDLKLQRLVNMEYIKIEKERDNLKATIDHLNNILNTVELFNKEIEKELKRVIDKYADPHRTVNIMLVKDDDEKPIETKNLVVTVSNNGLIQAMEADKFIAQKVVEKQLKHKVVKIRSR
jgi:DNA gyrase subunit A